MPKAKKVRVGVYTFSSIRDVMWFFSIGRKKVYELASDPKKQVWFID